MYAAAPVPLDEMTTSLPILYARTLSYLEKTSIVLMYRSKRLVDQEGEARSNDPLTGKDRSMLEEQRSVT